MQSQCHFLTPPEVGCCVFRRLWCHVKCFVASYCSRQLVAYFLSWILAVCTDQVLKILGHSIRVHVCSLSTERKPSLLANDPRGVLLSDHRETTGSGPACLPLRRSGSGSPAGTPTDPRAGGTYVRRYKWEQFNSLSVSQVASIPLWVIYVS